MQLALNVFKGNPLLFIVTFVSCLGLFALVVGLLKGNFTIKQVLKSSATWICIGVLVVGLGSVWALISFLEWQQDRQISIETAEAPAEIVSSESVWKSGGKSGSEKSYRIKYRYIVNGQTYQREFETLASGKYSLIVYAPKDKLKACFNPANPNESHLWENKFKCGSKPNW